MSAKDLFMSRLPETTSKGDGAGGRHTEGDATN